MTFTPSPINQCLLQTISQQCHEWACYILIKASRCFWKRDKKEIPLLPEGQEAIEKGNEATVEECVEGILGTRHPEH